MVNALRDKAFAESASCLAMTNLRKERFVPRDDGSGRSFRSSRWRQDLPLHRPP